MSEPQLKNVARGILDGGGNHGMSKITAYARAHGLLMVDAAERFVFTVSKDDIKRATKKNPNKCGFAAACCSMNGISNAFFFRTTAWLEREGKLVRYTLPLSVQKEIVAFDRGKAMEPGTYHLKPPAPSSRQGAPEQRRAEQKKKRSSKNRKLVAFEASSKEKTSRHIRHIMTGMREAANSI